jgi:hypothetical protein
MKRLFAQQYLLIKIAGQAEEKNVSADSSCLNFSRI